MGRLAAIATAGCLVLGVGAATRVRRNEELRYGRGAHDHLDFDWYTAVLGSN